MVRSSETRLDFKDEKEKDEEDRRGQKDRRGPAADGLAQDLTPLVRRLAVEEWRVGSGQWPVNTK